MDKEDIIIKNQENFEKEFREFTTKMEKVLEIHDNKIQIERESNIKQDIRIEQAEKDINGLFEKLRGYSNSKLKTTVIWGILVFLGSSTAVFFVNYILKKVFP